MIVYISQYLLVDPFYLDAKYMAPIDSIVELGIYNVAAISLRGSVYCVATGRNVASLHKFINIADLNNS